MFPSLQSGRARREPVPTATRLLGTLYPSTAGERIPSSILEGTHRADIAILGGGFVAIVAALTLARAGVNVCLLSSTEPGDGASGRTSGHIAAGLHINLSVLRAGLDPLLADRMGKLAMRSADQVFNLIHRNGIECDAVRSGVLRCANTIAGTDRLNAHAAHLGAAGVPIRLLDRAGTEAISGTEAYIAAVLDPRGGSLNPLAYLRGIGRLAQRAGAKFHAASPVYRIERQGREWCLHTPGGQLHARAILIADSTHAEKLTPRVGTQYRMIAATEPLPADVARHVLPRRIPIHNIDSAESHHRIDASGRLLAGGRTAPQTAGTRRHAHLAHAAEALWPELAGIRWTNAWVSRRVAESDFLPHMHTLRPDILLSMPANGRDIAMATAIGLQVAARILGCSQSDLSLPVTDDTESPYPAMRRAQAMARPIYARLAERLGL